MIARAAVKLSVEEILSEPSLRSGLAWELPRLITQALGTGRNSNMGTSV